MKLQLQDVEIQLQEQKRKVERVMHVVQERDATIEEMTRGMTGKEVQVR